MGADCNRQNKDLFMPIHLAVRKNQVSAIKWAVSINHENYSVHTISNSFDFDAPGGT